MVRRFATAALALAACVAPRGPVPPAAPDSSRALSRSSSASTAPSFAEIRDSAIAEWLSDDPATARRRGLHDFDGKVPDRSKAGISAWVARLEAQRRALAAVDEAPLSEDDRLDLALLRRHFDQERFDAVDRDEPHRDPLFYEDLVAVESYLDIPYAPLEQRARALLAHEEAALAEVPHVRENLVLPLSRPVSEVAARNFAGYAQYQRGEVARALRDVGDPAFRERFASTNRALAEQAEALAAWLERDVVPHGDDGHVLGPARYRELLAVQEALTLPLEDFERMGEDDLARNAKAYEQLAGRVKPTRPRPEELLAVARDQVARAREFVIERGIVSLPSVDAAEVRETPAYERWNLASLFASGPFDPAHVAFFQITLPDPAWPEREREEYVPLRGLLLSTTVHEVYPGHFVQLELARRAPTTVQKLSRSYSFQEGWAHYAEQMMIDEEGFGSQSPENRLGQVLDALLRDCRFLASIGIHARGMSVDAAARMFVERCHQGEAEAREQAVRGTFDPGYFAYTLGKLQILALRAEAKRRLGARFSLRAFHDALLSHGAPPVALIRERVLRELGAE